MRKNSKNRKILRSLYYTTYQVTGLNQNLFINKLKKSEIPVYNVKKKDNKTLLLTINSGKSEKLFAISKELCYNIKKVKDSGRFYPLLYLYRNVGVFIGVILMTISIILSNDFIFKIDYLGTGSVYKREAEQILNDEGVETFLRFSSLDFKSLSNKILSKSDKFSFVSIEKKGNRLNVYLSVANKTPSILTGEGESLISNVSGKIESIKVYRGRALKSVGEMVSVNEVIADGYKIIGEEKIFVGVIATATILSEIKCDYFSAEKDRKTYFELLSVESVVSGEVVGVNTEVVPTEQGQVYKIMVMVRHRISVT